MVAPVVLSACLLSGVIAVLALDYQDYQQQRPLADGLAGPATVALGIRCTSRCTISVPCGARLWSLANCRYHGGSLRGPYWLGPGRDAGGVDVIGAQVGHRAYRHWYYRATGWLSAPDDGRALITGVVATLFVDLLARLLPVKDERILGFALGLNGHDWYSAGL